METWERDNVVRKHWAARLNGGYTQTNIIIGNTTLPEVSASEVNVPEDSNPTDIYEEDSLHLGTLFGSD